MDLLLIVLTAVATLIVAGVGKAYWEPQRPGHTFLMLIAMVPISALFALFGIAMLYSVLSSGGTATGPEKYDDMIIGAVVGLVSFGVILGLRSSQSTT